MELSIKEFGDLLESNKPAKAHQSDLVGCYVIVRCRDAGVHAGELVSHSGREARLNESRRLWYWKPANDAKFLSGVAVYGLSDESKIGEPINVLLTETCEIIRCSEAARKSISEMKSDSTK